MSNSSHEYKDIKFLKKSFEFVLHYRAVNKQGIKIRNFYEHRNASQCFMGFDYSE